MSVQQEIILEGISVLTITEVDILQNLEEWR